MVKHIVAWRIADTRDKKETALEIKKNLEALKNEIEEICDIQVGINFNETENASDVVLVSTFKNKEDLAAYIIHPAHKAAGEKFVKPNVTERRVADYEF